MASFVIRREYLESNILRFVRMYIQNNHEPPHSIDLIAKCLGEESVVVLKTVRRMVAKGMLERENGRNSSPILICEDVNEKCK